MGKISTQAKARYLERIKNYKQIIEHNKIQEKALLKEIQAASENSGIRRIEAAEQVLNRVSYFVLMNLLSVSLLGVKNEGFLNEARKDIYKSIIYLEEAVSNYIDVPFSEYEEKLETLQELSDEARYALLQKLGFAIQSVKDGFGENTKWKWSFVEIEGRFATITKNLVNLKTVVSGMDPRVEGYEKRIAHIQLVEQSLSLAADRYREKYELSTLRIDDFKLAINYLSALRRLMVLIGQTEKAEQLRKKIDVWKNKMETDLKNLDKKKKSPT